MPLKVILFSLLSFILDENIVLKTSDLAESIILCVLKALTTWERFEVEDFLKALDPEITSDTSMAKSVKSNCLCSLLKSIGSFPKLMCMLSHSLPKHINLHLIFNLP